MDLSKDNHVHGKESSSCNCVVTLRTATQTLEEMEFERGIWYAGTFVFLYDKK